MGFAQYIKAPATEGKEKHIPDLSLADQDIGTVVKIQVGKEILHPTTKEHHIEWVQLFGETQDGKFVQVATLNFGKGTALPHGAVVINKADYTSFTAVSYCNLHGVWENTLAL